MKTIQTFKFPEGPTEQDVNNISKVLDTLTIAQGEIPCLLINGEGPFDVYYVRDHYQDKEFWCPPLWQAELIIYSKTEYEQIDLLISELDSLNYSCEMNDLMTGGEQFGQNDSSYERMNEISEQLRTQYQIH